jgi:hypothetical protein
MASIEEVKAQILAIQSDAVDAISKTADATAVYERERLMLVNATDGTANAAVELALVAFYQASVAAEEASNLGFLANTYLDEALRAL